MLFIRNEQEVLEDLEILKILVVDDVMDKVYPNWLHRTDDSRDMVTSHFENVLVNHQELVREKLEHHSLPKLHKHLDFRQLKAGMVDTLSRHIKLENQELVKKPKVKAPKQRAMAM